MGSGRRQVGRLRGKNCSNNNGGSVVVLPAQRLGDGLHKESMQVCAGDGRRQTTQQEGAVDDAVQAGGQGTTRHDVSCLERYCTNILLACLTKVRC
jgi:hypothetical protein